MEDLYLSLVLLFVVSLVSFFFIFHFYMHMSSSFMAPNLPPGRMGYPMIGESLEFISHPEKFIYERMQKYSSKVFKTSILGEPTVMFCGSACNKFLFSNENKLVVSWWPNNLKKIFPFSTKGEGEDKKLRGMLPRFIGLQALQGYVGVMDTIAHRHFADHWENNTQVSVYPLVKRYTFWLACRLFMSIDDPNHIAKLVEPFSVLVSGMISLPIDLPGTPFNRAIKASKLIRKELSKIIKQRKLDLADGKASSIQDILSNMLMSCDENGRYVSEQIVADKILGLLIGGHDTASSVCTFIVKYLAEAPPNIYQKVYQEQMEIAKLKPPGELLSYDDMEKMKYSWNVASEVMRLSPPIHGTFREVIKDFVFNGFTIPKGWKVYWSTSGTQKNSEYFVDAEKFDPSRFEGNGAAPYTFVPFGGGPRMCPGKEYARMEILVFIHNLVKRFKWENFIPDEKILIYPVVVPAKGLPVRLYPHQP